MRTWMRFLAVIAGVGAAIGLAADRAAAQKPAEPTVEIRLRSVNDLFDRGEYVGGLIGKDDLVRQARDLVKALSTEGKGVEGVDPAKPFGAYAVLTTDVASSPVVVMIPIADEKRFLQMLKDRLSVEPEKGDDGTLKASLPLVNEVVLRFADGYLYVGRSAADLAPKTLVTTKTFFANDNGAVASVLVRIDRIPDDLKALVIGQMELGIQRELKKAGAGAAEQKIGSFVADGVMGTTKTLAEGGKEFSLKLFVDPKADDLTAEVVLTAKDGSPLAKAIAGLANRSSVPAGIVAHKAAVVKGSARFGLTGEGKKELAGLVDTLAEELVKQAKPNEKAVAKRVLDTLAPTLKAGELDGAFTLSGPDSKGHYTILAAAAVKGGKDIEKLARDFAPLVPGDAVEFSFDVEKVGAFTLHKAEIKKTDDKFEKLFGTKTVWLATSDEVFALSVEPDGAAIKAGLKASPATVPVLGLEVSAAKLVPLIKPDLKPDELKALMKDAFGDENPAGKDTITLTVEGGDKLTGKLRVKGKVVRLINAVQQLGR